MTKLSLKNVIITILTAIVTLIAGTGIISDVTRYLDETSIGIIASVIVTVATFFSPSWLTDADDANDSR
ncbi:hypothetical protein [Breoghania sp.]|uniref:hypothetical protein n=1 Tax=Breoghania sp. TaxID=2065378 RepID=UPI002AA634B9|nr:hypothetical protein [Breoghania sp.]